MRPISIKIFKRSKETNWVLNIFIGLIIISLFAALLHTLIVRALDKFVPNISYEQEVKIWEFIKPSFGFDENYKLNERYDKDRKAIQALVDELPTSITAQNYPQIEILIMHDDYINAFAAPSGKIIITTGLLESLKSENAIMFVIGHEIGHFVKKDHLHEFARVISASFFSAMTVNSESIIMEILLMIDSEDSRLREYEADEWGIKTLMAKYGHIGGATEFFEVLLSSEDESTSDLLDTVSSHPSTISRIDRVLNKIKLDQLPLEDTKIFLPILVLQPTIMD